MSQWSTSYINDLPDSAFAYIAPGGKKDADGKTTPRSKRFFPHHDATGKVDKGHVDNAAARIPDSDLAAAAKDKAEAHIEAHQRKLGEKVAGRAVPVGTVETRSTLGGVESSEDGMHFSGYAIKFGEETFIRNASGRGGFYEVVDPDVRIDAAGAVAFWNHNPDIVLGTTQAGTQRLTRDAVGIRNDIDLPETTWGRDISVSVRRGDVSGQSFTFTVPEGGDSWERRSDGSSKRTLHHMGVIECGPVAMPAYAGTTAMVRSIFGHDATVGVDTPVEQRASFTVAQHVAAANQAILAAQEEIGANPQQAASLLVAGHNSIAAAAGTASWMDPDTAAAFGVDTNDIRTKLDTAQHSLAAAATAAHNGEDASPHARAAAEATAALMDVFNITGASMQPGGPHAPGDGTDGDDSIGTVSPAGMAAPRSAFDLNRLRLRLIGVGIKADGTD